MLTAKPAMSTAKRRPAGQESYRNQQLSPNNQKRNELRKSIEKANRDRSHVTGNSHRGLPERWRNNPQPIQLETSIYFGYIWFRQTDERHTCCRHRRNTGLLNNGISNEHVSQIFLAGYIYLVWCCFGCISKQRDDSRRLSVGFWASCIRLAWHWPYE